MAHCTVVELNDVKYSIMMCRPYFNGIFLLDDCFCHQNVGSAVPPADKCVTYTLCNDRSITVCAVYC